MAATGIHLFLDMLADYGVRYLFGNPGTTELPLSDALADEQRIRYILALQEVPAMAIADGYAQASRSPGVVNVHICCGLGNGMGMLYNAFREGTPLVLTAGQQDQRLMFEEPILWGEMVETVRPWTKWAAEIRRVDDLPSAVRRAVQTAMTPPTGPVFLSLPLDVQMADAAHLEPPPPALPPLEVRPPVEAVHRAAEVLARANNPCVLVGSRIVEADAVAELVAVAERLGAPVIHEALTSHGRCSFPSDHGLTAEPLPLWSPDVRARLDEFDVVLVAGMKLCQLYIYHEPARALPERCRIVHLDDDAWEIGKNYPVEVGVVGHPKPSLAELDAALNQTMTVEETDTARARRAARVEQHTSHRAALRRQAERFAEAKPVAPVYLMETLSRILPDDVAVVEEAPTTTAGGYFERAGALKNTDGYFAQRGWALGWGLNCAIGVQLAWPERPVLGLIGDGSAMYGCQGLWTAARYRLPVTFVVCNNAQYQILKDCARVLDLPAAMEDRYEGLDLVRPAVDYVGLAQSLGVPARKITEPDELAEAVSESFAQREGPRLFEVPVARPSD